jgi:hypothetical protein
MDRRRLEMAYFRLLTILFAAALAHSQSASNLNLAEIKTIDARTPREIQIQLAESAGPSSISTRATIYTLGKKGYELARRGSNGFTCIVDRQFPDTIEPECFDAEGSATTLKARLYVEKQRALGIKEEEIGRAVALHYKQGRFLAPRRPGIVYMLSDCNYVFDPDDKKIIHFPGHLMFYAPYLTAKEVGEGPGTPYLTHPGEPDNLMVVVPGNKTSHSN